VYATVSQPRVRLLRSDAEAVSSGPFVQVSRMGNPLFNELFVGLGDKGAFNRSSPIDDATLLAHYAENPQLAALINLIFGTSLPETGRSDLVALLIPDVLRVDTSTGPVSLAGQTQFSRLGGLGGDFASSQISGPISSGFPNGRRFGDDVVDILLSSLAFDGASISIVGDNVSANDQIYNQVFPYAATPHSAATNSNIIQSLFAGFSALQADVGSHDVSKVNAGFDPTVLALGEASLSAIPEPSSYSLMTTALIGGLLCQRCRKRASRTAIVRN
jgi:hypothetical protein